MKNRLSAKEAKRIYFGRLWSKRFVYSLGFLSLALTGSTQVLSPRILGWGIDLLKGNKIPSFFQQSSVEESFKFLFFSFLIVNLILLIARIGWRLCLARETHKASAFLKKNIWKNARYFSNNDLDKKFSVGKLMNCSTSDVGTARFLYGFSLIGVFDILFLGCFGLIMMYSINKEMTLYTLLLFLILPILIKKLSALEALKYERAQEYLSKFNDLTSQAVSTIRLQRLTQTGGFWEKKLGHSANSYRKKRLESLFTSYRYFPFMGASTVCAYGILFALGLRLVIGGQMSVGDFVTMQSLIFLIQDPLADIGFMVSEIQRSWTSLKRLGDIYTTPPAIELKDNGRDIEEKKQIFKIVNLNFKYPEAERKIFENLNFQLHKGERVGIMGPVGSGKSTFLNLISGLNYQFNGEIYFNERSLKEYSHPALRSYMALVPQKPFLFANTVRKNLSLDAELTDREVWHYLDMAGLKYDVENFKDGLDTFLGEWGINLSGGQKQRLTLARALAKRPKLLLLDDCLSAVDTTTEERILNNIDENLKETTIVWVAHRQSTLKYCDRIIEFTNGQ